MVLGLPWPRSYKLTVHWKERYANVRHGSASYGLYSDASRDVTQLQFQAASKLDLPLTILSSTSKVSPAGSRAPPANKQTDLRSSTHATKDANRLDELETEDGVTNEECSDMEIEYISLPKLKEEIRPPDLTGDQVFLCCMP